MKFGPTLNRHRAIRLQVRAANRNRPPRADLAAQMERMRREVFRLWQRLAEIERRDP